MLLWSGIPEFGEEAIVSGNLYPLKIRQAGSSLVHIAVRTGTSARTPCGFSPEAGYYRVLAGGPVTCSRCRDLDDGGAKPTEGPSD
ncbi:hypothetical protein ABIA33_002664 [Streptacidiphilus sp. MAP12-16]